MQQQSLLATKLYIPPTRPELVSRPRLIERLNAGLHGRLTLVSAPAGFGKTTLLSEWVHSIGAHGDAPDAAPPLRIAWLSLDEGDNDQIHFLAYLIAALRSIEANLAEGLLSALRPPGATDEGTPLSAEAVLTSLINEIAVLPRKSFLIFDDYHLIENPDIHDALSFLIEHLPPRMRLVIASREDPPLSLARLRARGQLTELRALDLRFTSSEAAEFLNQAMGLDLTAEDIAALEARTEGWIAGLQLAAISMQGRKDTASLVKSFTGSHRYVLDYLVEEVLDQQPKSIQTFLIQTSILSRLCAQLCNAVRFGSAESPSTPTGATADGQEILEALDRANLFLVPLDNERRWYRYHHLFADLLRNRLTQEHAEQLPALYQRAACWFEENGYYVDAIDHFIAAGAFQRAANTIKLGSDTVFQQQRAAETLNHISMLRWLDALPDELRRSDPRLSILYVKSAWELGRRTGPTLEMHLDDAQLAYDRLVDAGELTSDDPEFRLLAFDICLGKARAAIYAGDLELAFALAEEALALAPGDNPPALADAHVVVHWTGRESGHLKRATEACQQMVTVSQAAGYHWGVLEGLLGVGFAYQLQGQFRLAIQAYQQVQEYAEEQDLPWMRQIPITHFKWSGICYSLHDLAQAEFHLLRGIEHCERYGLTLFLNYGKIYLAQLRLTRGQDRAALETIQEVEKSTRRNRINAIQLEIDAYKAWIQAKLGNLRAAAAWLDTIDIQIDERLGFWQGVQGIQAAHVMVALDRLDEALDLLPRLEAAARAGGALPYLIESLVIQATVWQRKGQESRALDTVEEALVLAAPEGYVQVFLNEGLPMAQMLHAAAAREVAPDYAGRLLAAFQAAGSRSQTAHTMGFPPPVVGSRMATSASSSLVEPLSERELEVLQLIAQGLTNREIASRLFLSLNTVKAHTRNIYGKLDVHSRTQAVSRAGALGILPST